MRRDRRLAAAIVLLALAAVAAVCQAIVIHAFIIAAMMGGWEYSSKPGESH